MSNGSQEVSAGEVEQGRCNEGSFQCFKRIFHDVSELIEFLQLLFVQVSIQWSGDLREVRYEAALNIG